MMQRQQMVGTGLRKLTTTGEPKTAGVHTEKLPRACKTTEKDLQRCWLLLKTLGRGSPRTDLESVISKFPQKRIDVASKSDASWNKVPNKRN